MASGVPDLRTRPSPRCEDELALFRKMLDSLPVAVYTTDAEGVLTYYNSAAARFAGRTPELGKDRWCITWKMLSRDGAPVAPEQSPLALALRGSEVPGNTTYIAVRPDGTQDLFTSSATVVRDAEGRIAGAVSVILVTGNPSAAEEEGETICGKAALESRVPGLKEALPLLALGASANSSSAARVYHLAGPLHRGETFKPEQQAGGGDVHATGEQAGSPVPMEGQRSHARVEHPPAGERPFDRTFDGRNLSKRERAERAALLLEAVVDSSDDAIISKDLNGIITSWNKSAERLFGYSADEVIGESVTILIPPERLHEETMILDRLRRGERIQHFETLRRRKDGTMVEISLTISPVKDRFGNIIGASKIARDISKTMRTERAANLLAAIVDSSDDAIISKDLDGIITSWNKSAERLFGYTAEEAIGQPVTMLIPTDRLDEEPAILNRLRRGERVDHFETIRRKKDGTLMDISLTISPVRDRHGKVIGASKIARSITERKRWEAALVESEAKFRQLADAMPQIVWTARPDGYLDYFNERWYEFTGFARHVFGDESWERILHAENVEECRKGWYDAVRSGKPYKSEYRFWDRRRRQWRWFMARALPVRNASGEIVKWFGSWIDIEAQKRVEDDLRRANHDLEQFAFSASHDLQEPLRSVKIYSELLASEFGDAINSEARSYLTYLQNGATRMEMLIRDLLSYTQLVNFEKPTEPVDSGEVLASTLESIAGVIEKTGARITAEDLPPVTVHKTHLHQLFLNLIGNALKYRDPERVPTVRITAERQNGSWSFAIADNGIGIARQYTEKIFGLFKRLHTSDEYSGTGIGLALCRRIVERYHGRIWVDSEPGRGSTFRFTLPG